jgi:SanA protein
MSRWIVAACVTLLTVSALTSFLMDRIARRRMRSNAETLPPETLVVLLGCPIRNRSGGTNQYFLARAAAGAAAYHSLEARRLDESKATRTRVLCSGLDTHGEVTAFVEALTRAGVPVDRIELDGRAVRTRDSIEIVAARATAQPVAFVSQAFHLPRVLFLARALGIDAYGLSTRGDLRGLRARLRERLARIRALLDVPPQIKPR